MADIVSRPPGPENCTPGSGPSSISRRSTIASVAPAGVHTMSVFAPVRAAHLRRGNLGQPPRRGQGGGALLDRPVLRQHSPTPCVDVQVLGPPDIEAESWADRWSHLPGGMPAPVHVGQAAQTSDAHAGRLPLRSVHSPRRKRDRHQRPERGDGGAGRTGPKRS